MQSMSIVHIMALCICLMFSKQNVWLRYHWNAALIVYCPPQISIKTISTLLRSDRFEFFSIKSSSFGFENSFSEKECEMGYKHEQWVYISLYEACWTKYPKFPPKNGAKFEFDQKMSEALWPRCLVLFKIRSSHSLESV